MRLARLFWIVACLDLAGALGLMGQSVTGGAGRYGALLAIVLLGFMVLVGALMGVVALIRRPLAYGIGLALVAVPPLSLGGQFVADFVLTPSGAALQAGHGYFDRRAERALADAIVAGDAAKVATLAPAARLDTIGWYGMTFMRLALEEGRADPDVVVALLKAGVNPDQGQQELFGSMNDGSQATSGAMITGRNERLLRAVMGAGVDLNRRDLEGRPRYFSALRWPEGLAILLEHGADVEAESADGNTALMWAVMFGYWPAIDVLLAHGARIDHGGQDGKGLRDLVEETVTRYRSNRNEIPGQLAALEARYR